MGTTYAVPLNSIMAKVVGVEGENRGELIRLMNDKLRSSRDLALEEIVIKNPLLIMRNKEEATEAWRAAGEGSASEAPRDPSAPATPARE